MTGKCNKMQRRVQESVGTLVNDGKLEGDGRRNQLILRRRAPSLLAAVFVAIWLCASHCASAGEATVGVETRDARADQETTPPAPPQLLSVEVVPDVAAGTVEKPPAETQAAVKRVISEPDNARRFP